MDVQRNYCLVLLGLTVLFYGADGKPTTSELDIDWNTFQNPELGPHFEGDIIVSDTGTEKTGLRDESYRWENKTLVYTIGSGFTPEQKQLIYDAIDELTEKTCIQFVQRTNEEDYVEVVTTSSGCFSNIGRIGGRQRVNLESGCFKVGKGTVVHEIMHALGVNHEHTRPDRDDYVKIHFDRIKEAMAGNFRKENINEVDDFGESYDYGSLMHYPKNAFYSDPNNKETISVKHEGAVIGQRKEMSSKDVQRLNTMYKCN